MQSGQGAAHFLHVMQDIDIVVVTKGFEVAI